jgi:hypothetical protein
VGAGVWRAKWKFFLDWTRVSLCMCICAGGGGMGKETARSEVSGAGGGSIRGVSALDTSVAAYAHLHSMVICFVISCRSLRALFELPWLPSMCTVALDACMALRNHAGRWVAAGSCDWRECGGRSGNVVFFDWTCVSLCICVQESRGRVGARQLCRLLKHCFIFCA